MIRRALPLVALTGVLLLPSAVPQKRVKPKGPADFPSTLQAAQSAWKEGRYGTCVKELKTALGLATEKRAESIRAALPDAPEGWSVVPERDDAAQNPFAAAMAASVGSVVERSYRQEGGSGTVKVTVTADSPLVQMFAMWTQNPAMLGPDAELIEYEEHTAVLKKEGQARVLQILVAGAHVCEARARGLGEDGLFAMFDQAFVDGLAKVLGD